MDPSWHHDEAVAKKKVHGDINHKQCHIQSPGALQKGGWGAVQSAVARNCQRKEGRLLGSGLSPTFTVLDHLATLVGAEVLLGDAGVCLFTRKRHFQVMFLKRELVTGAESCLPVSALVLLYVYHSGQCPQRPEGGASLPRATGAYRLQTAGTCPARCWTDLAPLAPWPGYDASLVSVRKHDLGGNSPSRKSVRWSWCCKVPWSSTPAPCGSR